MELTIRGGANGGGRNVCDGGGGDCDDGWCGNVYKDRGGGVRGSFEIMSFDYLFTYDEYYHCDYLCVSVKDCDVSDVVLLLSSPSS